MRRPLAFVGLWLIVAASATLQADVLTIGSVSFDNLIPASPPLPGVNAFDITNLTGDPSATSNAAKFLNASLTLSDGTVIALGDIAGPSYFFNLPTSEFSDAVTFTSAEFKATLDQTTFSLPGGGSFVADSTAIDVVLNPSLGETSLVAGVDFVPINISNVPTTVPEPRDLLVLLSSCVWAFTKARRAGRRT